ncbi:MAG: FAD-dependent oxidoreductase [Desulfobacterales bacterium]|jgi:NAD(P)H-nitrite reductase large subunit
MNQKGSRKHQRHLIIGNSAAALNAVKAIRENDSTSKITLVSAEKHYAYSPVLLTYYVSQKIKRSALFLADQNFYRQYGVELILGNPAVRVSPRNRKVTLANKDILNYDNLLIATGSSPKPLGIPGEDLPGVFTLKTIDDADKLVKFGDQMKDVVIIGGGLIGLQAANALFSPGRNVKIIIGSKQPLSQNVDPSCAENVCQGIRECGMTVIFETQAVSIEKTKNKLSVALSSNQLLEADAVIIGKGVNPNIRLVEESEIEINQGILVDETMRTNVPNVFAAGDVAEGLNLITGQRQVIATWPNACSQGQTAGINMTGGMDRNQGLNNNICGFLGSSVASVGITKPDNNDYEEVVSEDPAKGRYRKLVWNKKDELVGAVLMGKVADIGIISNLIRNRVRIPKEKREQMARSTIRYGDYFSEKAAHFF